ncbi:glycoside hydrolase family 78 protein [Pedobacter panaciterrae]
MKFLYSFLLMLFTISMAEKAYSNEVKPSGLQCEHLINPIGVDLLNPRLSWMMTDTRQGAKQTAYRIIVGKDSSEVAKKGAFRGSRAK